MPPCVDSDRTAGTWIDRIEILSVPVLLGFSNEELLAPAASDGVSKSEARIPNPGYLIRTFLSGRNQGHF